MIVEIFHLLPLTVAFLMSSLVAVPIVLVAAIPDLSESRAYRVLAVVSLVVGAFAVTSSLVQLFML
ncbi:hypothetical protein [Marinobacter sp.]|uniref:hypothetical protein n=1 Tax=Marinobacter sp. TaxID=50741 RepID=UPI00261BB9A0|nr:hypothetical protein [Marinobacter sp.]